MAQRSDVAIPLGNGRTMRAVVVRPDGSAPPAGWPGVVVLHEVFGLEPDIVAVGERFAALGWAAIVPDYFSAGSKLGCLVRAAREVQSGRPGPVTAMLAAAAVHLGEQTDVDADRLAAIGFCMGGGFALLLGAAAPEGIRAVAANYGDVPAEDVLRSSPPVVASYGGRDRIYGPKASVLRDRLNACGVANDVRTYDDAGHSFMTSGEHPVARLLLVPLQLGYVAAAADDAWGRVFAWLDRHVTAGRAAR